MLVGLCMYHGYQWLHDFMGWLADLIEHWTVKINTGKQESTTNYDSAQVELLQMHLKQTTLFPGQR